MIDRMINEIKEALSNKLYMSALALALTLPDTCGKAEYPEKSTTARYKEWCKKYVLENTGKFAYGNDMPYLSDEIIYSLRNSLLHQSTPNIYQEDIKEKRCKVNKFELVASQDYSTNGDESYVSYCANFKVKSRELRIHISHLCYIICVAAENYYKNNKNKFSFIEYEIIEE